MSPDFNASDPIPFNDDATAPAAPTASPRTQSFSTLSSREPEDKLRRKTQISGQGATRTRTFHAKLNDGAMAFLDGQINDWLDQHPDYEVKFATTTIGIVEGKRQEPHLIINVWY